MAVQLQFTQNYAFADGTFAAGALASFFQSGTTTPVTTYSDEALTTPNPVPLVADASGRFATVWGPDGAQFKAVVTESDGSALATLDPVVLGNVAAGTADDTSLDPVPGLTATDVQAAIEELQTDKADSATLSADLGLGGLATEDILDEDDFATDSATRPPSQQSTKAYVDGQVNTTDLGTFSENGGVIVVTGIPATGTGFGEYNGLFLDIDRINLSGTANLLIELSTDGGATWQTTSYQWVARGRDAGGADQSGQSNSASAITVTPSPVGGTLANSPVTGTINLSTPTLAQPRMWGHLLYTDSANDLVDATFSGFRGNTSTHNALRFSASTGTITGGSVTMWARA